MTIVFGDGELIRMTFTFTFYIFADQLNRIMVLTGRQEDPDIDNRQVFGDVGLIMMTFTFYIFGDQLNRSMVVTGEAGRPRY